MVLFLQLVWHTVWPIVVPTATWSTRDHRLQKIGTKSFGKMDLILSCCLQNLKFNVKVKGLGGWRSKAKQQSHYGGKMILLLGHLFNSIKVNQLRIGTTIIK